MRYAKNLLNLFTSLLKAKPDTCERCQCNEEYYDLSDRVIQELWDKEKRWYKYVSSKK